MNPKIIKKTQDTLGKAIKKPPLTEKLLTKPPFRFLHDVMTEVIKNTGVLQGLYVDSELNSANVTEKEAKIAFLQKAIDCVGMTLGESLTARPSKIVAGHEPVKTNEFLQALGKICLKKIDTSDSVKKVLAGEKPKKSASRTSSKDGQEEGKVKEKESKEKLKDKDVIEEKQSKEKTKDKAEKADDGRDKRSKDRKEAKENKNKDKKPSSGSSRSKEEKTREDRKERKSSSKEREGSSKEREGSSKERDKSATKERDRSSNREKRSSKSADREKSSSKHTKEEKESEKPRRERSSKESEKRDKRDRNEKDRKPEKTVDTNNNENELDDNQTSSRSIQRPASAKGQRRRPSNPDTASDNDLPDQEGKENEAPSSTSLNTDSQSNLEEPRKQSALRRPARPSSARPAPPKIKKPEAVGEPQAQINSGKPLAPVIMDNKKDQDDEEDDTFIVEEDPSLQNFLEIKSSESNPDMINTAEHGSLVRKMLESKKDADARQKTNQNDDKPVLFDAARRKEKEMAEREIEKLRGSIQHLVRSAHPLGKILDYIQEDIDSMQKEHNIWKEENKKHEKALKAEQSITESEIEPLQAHLADLELEITEMMDNISAIKSNILRNEDKIEDLVYGISR